MSQVLPEVLGTSDAFLQFEERLGLLAAADRPVLVLGERGTGKELAVQRLHYRSGRWEKPLVTVLCPALSPTLLESELFGHEAGAFTGARGRRMGYLERANGGTLFLDEVADMPLSLQDKLLRVIEYGEFERVGGSAVVHVDVRVVAATNGDLPRLAAEGRFRADLLDRLAFDVLHVPPLRCRGEDKLLLARHFAAGMAAELGLMDMRPDEGEGSGYAGRYIDGNINYESDGGTERFFGPVFGSQALEILETYSWPGNIRELKNVVERSVARRRSLYLDSLDIDPFISPYHASSAVLQKENIMADVSAVLKNTSEMCAGTACYDNSHDFGECKTCENGYSLHFHHSLPDNFCLHEQVHNLEIAALNVALEQAKYRQTVAARLLGLSYHQFRALLRKCGNVCSKDDRNV